MSEARTLTADEEKHLVDAARKARENAVAPYSGFRVGAALLAGDGTIYGGCNVESASYGLTVCAERTAVFKAISEGARTFRAVAVVTGSDPPASVLIRCKGDAHITALRGRKTAHEGTDEGVRNASGFP